MKKNKTGIKLKKKREFAILERVVRGSLSDDDLEQEFGIQTEKMATARALR